MFLPRNLEARVLSSSTVEAIYRIVGEERLPSARILRALFPLIPVFDWTTWIRQVDLCLVGGDPVTLSLRLRRAVSDAQGAALRSIGLICPGDFSGAPLKLLDDPIFVRDLVERGLLPRAAVEGVECSAGIIEGIVGLAVEEIERAGARGVYAVDHAQGGRAAGSDEILMRLTRRRGRPRDGDRQRRPISGLDGRQMRSANEGGGWLFDDSAKLSSAGLDTLRKAMVGRFEAPPRGSRFADVIIARRCEVMSGFISPSEHQADDLGVEFMEQELGAQVYGLARAVPSSVADAVEIWLEDLTRAVRPPVVERNRKG